MQLDLLLTANLVDIVADGNGSRCTLCAGIWATFTPDKQKSLLDLHNLCIVLHQ